MTVTSERPCGSVGGKWIERSRTAADHLAGSVLILILTAALAIPAYALEEAPSEGTPSVEEIVTRLEENRTYSSRSEATMTIVDRFGERVSSMISWSRGAEEFLIEFTSAAEYGQKVLRTEDEIYLYYPDAAELVRLQGQALRESMLGSDVSYEDLTGGRTLLEEYDAVLEGRETIDGHDTWRVTLEARVRDVAYPLQTLWIDTEIYMSWRTELYSLNGRLLKTITVETAGEIDGVWIPLRSVIVDALRSNSSTTMEIESVEIGLTLDDDLFSLEELSW